MASGPPRAGISSGTSSATVGGVTATPAERDARTPPRVLPWGSSLTSLLLPTAASETSVVRPSRATRSAAAVLAGAVLVACGGSGEATEPTPSPVATASPSPSPTPAPSPSPTTIDVAAVPAEIDVAYAQAVMDALDAELGELARGLAAAGGEAFDEEAVVHISSLYSERVSTEARENWETHLLPELPDDPGAPVTTVHRVPTAGEDCFVLEAARDLSPLGVPEDVIPEGDWVFVLVRRGGAPDDFNPTPWVIDIEATELPEAAPCGE